MVIARLCCLIRELDRTLDALQVDEGDTTLLDKKEKIIRMTDDLRPHALNAVNWPALDLRKRKRCLSKLASREKEEKQSFLRKLMERAIKFEKSYTYLLDVSRCIKCKGGAW